MDAPHKGRKFSIDSYASSASWNVRGWLTVAAGFVLFGVTISPSNSFNILFVPIQESFNATAVETGAIGSMVFTSQLLSSGFAFLLERCVGYRAVVVISTVLCALSIFASAFATSMVLLGFTFGLVYGSACGLCFHSVICVMIQHFQTKSTRGTAVMLLGASFGVLIYSQLLELTLSTLGWRPSLLILSGLVLVPGLPVSCLIIPVSSAFPSSNQPHEEHLIKTMMRKISRDSSQKYRPTQKCTPAQKLTPKTAPLKTSRRVDGARLANYKPASERGHSSKDDWLDEYTPWKEWNSQEASCSSSSGKSTASTSGIGQRDSKVPSRKRKHSIGSLSWCGDCKAIMRMGRMWVFSAATLFAAMAWCVFFVNIGSFFDSVGLNLSEVAILLMVMAAADIAGKIYLATVGETVPVAKIHFLIGQSVIMTAVSTILIYTETYIAMVFLSIVIGFMKSLWMTLPYTVSVEVIGTKYADQSITVTLFCQGLGNVLGTLPAGAIFDATGSYQLVFKMVAACTLSAAVLYSVLPFLRQKCILPPLFRQTRSEQFRVVATNVSSGNSVLTVRFDAAEVV